MDLCSKIVSKLVVDITAACQTPFATTDATRVNTVQHGMFQDDPTDALGPVVSVERNDHRNRESSGIESGWLDEQDDSDMGLMGGAAVERWRRRFTVVIRVWPGKIQKDAEECNSTIVARVRKVVTQADMTGQFDVFGERILIPTNPIRKIRSGETGGPEDEYGWETTLFLEYLTEYNPGRAI